jgi:hypothetical protein
LRALRARPEGGFALNAKALGAFPREGKVAEPNQTTSKVMKKP